MLAGCVLRRGTSKLGARDYGAAPSAVLRRGRGRTELHARRASGSTRRSPRSASRSSNLEADVGVPLLDRSKRHVALTEGGKVFLGDSQRDFGAPGPRGRACRSRAARKIRPKLVIGVVPAAEIKILPKLIPLVERNLPTVRLVFHNLPSAEQKRLLAMGSLDFGLLRGPLEDPRLEVEDILLRKARGGSSRQPSFGAQENRFHSPIERCPVHHGVARGLAGIARRRPDVL